MENGPCEGNCYEFWVSIVLCSDSCTVPEFVLVQPSCPLPGWCEPIEPPLKAYRYITYPPTYYLHVECSGWGEEYYDMGVWVDTGSGNCGINEITITAYECESCS